MPLSDFIIRTTTTKSVATMLTFNEKKVTFKHKPS